MHVKKRDGLPMTIACWNVIESFLPVGARSPAGQCRPKLRRFPVHLFRGFSPYHLFSSGRVDGLPILASLFPTHREASVSRTKGGIHLIDSEDDPQRVVIPARAEVHMPCERVYRYGNGV